MTKLNHPEGMGTKVRRYSRARAGGAGQRVVRSEDFGKLLDGGSLRFLGLWLVPCWQVFYWACVWCR